MNQELTGSEEGLIGYWNFNQGSGSIASDLTGNDRDGTIVEAVRQVKTPYKTAEEITFTVTEPPAHGTLKVVDNQSALSFDGINDSVQNSSKFEDVTDTFTVEFWVNPTGLRQNTPEANSGISGTSNQRYAIAPLHGQGFLGSRVQAYAGVSVGTNGISVFEHSGSYLPSLLVHNILLSGWNHITIVYRDKTPSLYLNGEFVKTGLISTKVVHPSAQIGDVSNYGPFQGSLDEVRIWDKAKTQAEIQADMNRQLTGNEAGLVGYWQFNEGFGTTATDLSGNNNDGTILGATWSPGILSNGPALNVGDTFTQADINEGRLVYHHDGSETAADNFSFSVDDGESTPDGQTFDITINPVPAVLAFSKANYSINEDGTPVDLEVTVIRTDDYDGEVSATITLTDGTATEADYDNTNIPVTFADGENSQPLSIVINDDALEETDETFILTLTNPGTGSVIRAQNTATVTIIDDDVEIINTSPTTADNTLTTEEDTDRAFVAADFNFSDVDSGDTLQEVRIETLPAEGILYLDANGNSLVDTDEAVAAGESISVSAINAGEFKFKPDPDENGTPYTSFTFSVSDGFAFSDPATLMLNVTPVNDAPTDIQLSQSDIDENSANGTIIGDLSIIDPDPDDTHTLTLVDDAGGRFTLVDEQLQVADGSLLDAETNTSHAITIEATDAGGLSLQKDLIITVNDIDEAPLQPGTLSFSLSSYSVNEGSPTASVTVTRTGGSEGAVSTTVSLTDGTATAPADYDATPRMVQFADGDSISKTVTVPIVDDSLVECNETINLNLTNLTGGATLGNPQTATLTIIDNDRVGNTWGDPHLITFDKFAYDFQAVGEFVLVESDSDDWQVQARLQPVANSDSVSVFTGVATQVDGQPVGFYANQDIPLEINGSETVIDDGNSLSVGNSLISREGETYTLIYAGQDGIINAETDDRLVIDNFTSHLFLGVYPSTERYGSLSGLLGNANGTETDDFTLRDGTPLSIESLSFRQFYSLYADSWRINQSESLFSYETGEDTNTFTDRNFPSDLASLNSLDPALRSAAEQAAREAGVPEGPRLTTAVLDFAVTGDPSFFEAAAAAQCTNRFLPPPPRRGGNSWGAPHQTTFDGISYDFQAVGEFIFAESEIDDWEIQVRQQPWRNSNMVAVNTGVATLVDGFEIGLYAGQAQPLLIDGAPNSVDNGGSLTIGNSKIVRNGNTYTIIYAGNDGIITPTDDQLVVTANSDHLNLSVLLAYNREGEVQGLLGDGDGNPGNDFALRDGTVLSRPVPFDTLYGEFADSWRLSQEESLFVYEPGEDTATFTDPNFPGTSFTVDDLDPAVRAAAETAAREAGIPEGPALDAAILDYAVTDDPAFLDGAVAAVNETPLATDDTLTLDPGDTLTLDAPGVLANDSDGDGDPLTVSLVTDVTSGTLTLSADGSLTYEHDGSDNFTDYFTYRVSDGIASALGTVSLLIAPPNTTPVAADDNWTTREGEAVSGNVLDNDSDEEGDPLRAVPIDDVANGTLTLASDGNFTYTPNPGFVGTDTFTYQANDGQADSNVATVTVEVRNWPVTTFDVINDHVLGGEANLTFTLANQGSSAIEPFEMVMVYSDDEVIGNSDDLTVGSTAIAGMAVGDEITDTLTVQLPKEVLNENAQAEDPPDLGDEYLSNNVDYIGLLMPSGEVLALDDITYFPWDIDGSGQVTPTDAIFVINRLGQTTNAENALADFDGSGEITPTDSIAAINRLGYTLNSDVMEMIT